MLPSAITTTAFSFSSARSPSSWTRPTAELYPRPKVLHHRPPKLPKVSEAAPTLRVNLPPPHSQRPPRIIRREHPVLSQSQTHNTAKNHQPYPSIITRRNTEPQAETRMSRGTHSPSCQRQMADRPIRLRDVPGLPARRSAGPTGGSVSARFVSLECRDRSFRWESWRGGEVERLTWRGGNRGGMGRPGSRRLGVRLS